MEDGGEWGWRRMRRIEALTDRSRKYIAFSKAALVREIVLSLIRLRTVSSYETDSQKHHGIHMFSNQGEEEGEKGEVYRFLLHDRLTRKHKTS